MAENVSIPRDLAREIRKAKQVTSLEDGDQLLTFRETDRGKPDLRRVAQTAVASQAGLASGAVPVGSATAADNSNKVGVGPTLHNITAMWRGTQAEYDALGSYSATTLYVVVG